jgi:hypothetical protein
MDIMSQLLKRGVDGRGFPHVLNAGVCSWDVHCQLVERNHHVGPDIVILWG